MGLHANEPIPNHVRRSQGAIRHIVNEHLLDSVEGPLWVNWLDSSTDLDDALSDRLDAEIERSFQHRLLVEYDQHDSAGCFLHRTWELITRSGLVVVVRHADDGELDLMTAFFPYEAYIEKPHRRWLAAVRSRIKLYTARLPLGLARHLIIPPSPDQSFVSQDPPGQRRNVRFLCLDRWGFRPVEWRSELLPVWRTPGAWPID